MAWVAACSLGKSVRTAASVPVGTNIAGYKDIAWSSHPCLSSLGRDYNSRPRVSGVKKHPWTPTRCLASITLLPARSSYWYGSHLVWTSRGGNWQCPALTCLSLEMCCRPDSPSSHTAWGCWGPETPSEPPPPPQILCNPHCLLSRRQLLRDLLLFTFSISPIKLNNDGMFHVFTACKFWTSFISKFSLARMRLHYLNDKISEHF